LNRFNGLFEGAETVETVTELFLAVSTPLKWGVNESMPVFSSFGNTPCCRDEFSYYLTILRCLRIFGA
jgi:hypothetical protein